MIHIARGKTAWFSTLLFLALHLGTKGLLAQSFLTADIQKPFYSSVRISSSISKAFYTGSIFGSYSYEDYLQIFAEVGHRRIDLGPQLPNVDGYMLSAGFKNKYYTGYPDGIAFDMAWLLKFDLSIFSESKNNELDFQLMSLSIGQIFSKKVKMVELYSGFGILYSINNYDGPPIGDSHIPNNFDFYVNGGIHWVPKEHIVVYGEAFIFEKPGIGAALEIYF